MAEADPSLPSQPSATRFFCHKCNHNISHVLEDFTCPTCGCGFIEELPADSNSGTTNSSTPSGSVGDFAGLFGSGADQSNVLSFDFFDLLSGGQGRRRRGNDSAQPNESGQSLVSSTTSTPSQSGSRSGGTPGHQFSFVIDARPRQGAAGGQAHANADNPVENMLYSFLTDLISGLGGGVPGNATIPMLSNLGDYVWGRDGLDAIVTQLMNQMEGTGPPPLSTDKLDNLQSITINQEQIDRKLQCSVCWEDFKLSEEVKQLECDHIYHPDCILPWLKLHATCPICRRDFTDGSQPKDGEPTTTNQSATDNPSQSSRTNVQPVTIPPPFNFLNAPFSIATANSSTNSTSSNTNTSTQPPQGRGHGPGSNLDNMDFEFD